jgi:sulfite exporter TauE/SafE
VDGVAGGYTARRRPTNTCKEAAVAIGTSIVLIAVGAILKFAVNVDTNGFNLNTVGVILMVVGVIGLLVSLLMGSMWADRRAGREVVREREVL